MSNEKKTPEIQEEGLITEPAEGMETQGENTEEAVDLQVKFRKPYRFEGKDYDGVDLSGLEDTTAAALENVGRILLKKRPGLNPSTIEMTMEYANLLASRVTHLPEEFFERLPAKEAMKVKTTVVGFLYGGGGGG